MYSFLAEKVIYPLGDLALGTSVIKYYHWLQKTQWWTTEQLKELQDQKLRRLIGHAYDNVPYYRRLFDSLGLTPGDIRGAEDLMKLPALTKKDIRANFDDLKTKDFRKYKPIPDATGGSTGEPLKLYITEDVASINWAGMFRGWNWAGYKLGDKRISFGGSSLVPNKAPTRFEITRRKLERNLPFSAVSMNDTKYEKLLQTIRTYHPKFFYGYASSIYLLADYCKSNNMKDIKFDAVFSTAEMLLPNYRSVIENAFQCKVFDQYGFYDGGGQAMECSVHKGFHISAEKVIFEVVDENGRKVPPGKSGRILVTDLYNYAMPFIRYEVGDMGVLDDNLCTCGRGLPLLKTVEGRDTDIIRLSNGIVIASIAIPHLLKDCHIKQYQFVQESGDKLLIKIVKNKDYSEWDTNHIMSVLQHHAGNDATIELEFRDSIPALANNKHRFIISKLGDQASSK